VVVSVQRSLFDVPESATSAMSDEDMFNEVSTQVHRTTLFGVGKGRVRDALGGSSVGGDHHKCPGACLVLVPHGACDVRCSGERADV
jgi:hypothetical protein